jgi:hypothetical protein
MTLLKIGDGDGPVVLSRPTKLNIGAGNRIMPMEDGWVNHDRWAHRPEITTTHDLEDYPWPWADDAFTEILAFDVLEHVLKPMRMIEELWRIAAPDAIVKIHTAWASPHIEHRRVWRDPQHVRPFHELSFAYFDPTDGNGWYSGYGQFYSPARFKVEGIEPEPPDNIMFHLRALKFGSWMCEVHPSLVWPHGECAGPGVPWLQE